MAGWKGGRPYCWRGGWISAEARSACALGGDRAAEVGLVRFPKNPRVTPAEYDRADVPGDEEPRLRDRDGADPGKYAAEETRLCDPDRDDRHDPRRTHRAPAQP